MLELLIAGFVGIREGVGLLDRFHKLTLLQNKSSYYFVMTILFSMRLGGRGIASDAKWVVAGQVVSAVITLASIRVVTELLSPVEFGRLTLLLAVSALALGLSVTPQLQALVRYYPDWDRLGQIQKLRKVGGKTITRSVCISATIIVCGWASFYVLLADVWFTGLLIVALLIVDSIRSFEFSLLNAGRRQRDAAILHTADSLSRPLMAIVVVACFGSSTNAVLVGYVLGSGLVVAVVRFFIRMEGEGCKSNPRSQEQSQRAGQNERSLVRKIHSYSMPLVPLAIFGWLSGVGDRYLITGVLGLDAAGLYAAAFGLASRPFLMMSTAAELIFRPIIHNSISNDNWVAVQKAKFYWLVTIGIGSTIGVICFYCLSGVVGYLFLAEEYGPAIELMPWIAIGYAIYSLATAYTRFCYAFEDTKAVLILTVGGALSGLLILIPALYLGGLWGAAITVSLKFGIELLLAYLLARGAEARFCRTA